MVPQQSWPEEQPAGTSLEEREPCSHPTPLEGMSPGLVESVKPALVPSKSVKKPSEIKESGVAWLLASYWNRDLSENSVNWLL